MYVWPLHSHIEISWHSVWPFQVRNETRRHKARGPIEESATRPACPLAEVGNPPLVPGKFGCLAISSHRADPWA